jgi:ornithine--oxo-acid transaminase
VTETPVTDVTRRHIETMERYSARNYHPLPLVLEGGEGVWVWDVEGRRYLDCLAAYSALNFGHRHPQLVAALEAQLARLTLTSRAFHNDQLPQLCEELVALSGLEAMLPMNTGAEAVETAIKAARRWGYVAKGIPHDQAEIVVCEGNFHGRTTTIVSFSSDDEARDGFGPFTPGFVAVPYGDSAALEAAVTERTAAVLIEPVQGERGVVVPPPGYLRAVRRLCDEHHVLMIADEIQSGLGRTGATLACDHEDVRPDLLTLGKALGGGLLPVSALLGSRAVMDVFTPGSHGSTFGGNPLACAVALEVTRILAPGTLQRRAAALGMRLREQLASTPLPGVAAVRTAGLWAGIDLEDGTGSARSVCEALAARGVLCKETHVRTIRLAPPLVIEEDELDWGVEQLRAVLADSAS